MIKNVLLNVIIVYVFVFFQNTLVLSNNEDIKGMFLKEAPQKWQEYLNYCVKLEGTITFRQYDQNTEIDSEQSITISNVFPYNSLEMFTTDVNDKNKKLKRVKGYNSKYNFELIETDDKKWRVTNLTNIAGLARDELFKLNYAVPFQNEHTTRELGVDFLKSRLVPGVELTPLESLPLIVSLPEFNLKSIDIVNVNEKKYVEIIYEFEPPNGKYPIVIGSGKFLLLPDTWLIKSGEFFRTNSDNNGGNRIIYHIDNTYNFDNPVMPNVIKRTKQSFTQSISGTKAFRSHEESIYNLYETKDKDIKRFTLSHYGLPEPDFGERWLSRSRVILMGLGLLLIVISLCVIMIKERIKQRSELNDTE
jgi:hypothetical protein